MITDEEKKFFKKTGTQFKTSFTGLLQFFVKFFSCLALGLVFALIGDELIAYGSFSFFFVLISIAMGFYRICRKWTLIGVLVFDLLCFLVAVLMRMYITIAPEL